MGEGKRKGSKQRKKLYDMNVKINLAPMVSTTTLIIYADLAHLGWTRQKERRLDKRNLGAGGLCTSQVSVLALERLVCAVLTRGA